MYNFYGNVLPRDVHCVQIRHCMGRSHPHILPLKTPPSCTSSSSCLGDSFESPRNSPHDTLWKWAKPRNIEEQRLQGRQTGRCMCRLRSFPAVAVSRDVLSTRSVRISPDSFIFFFFRKKLASRVPVPETVLLRNARKNLRIPLRAWARRGNRAGKRTRVRHDETKSFPVACTTNSMSV